MTSRLLLNSQTVMNWDNSRSWSMDCCCSDPAESAWLTWQVRSGSWDLGCGIGKYFTLMEAVAISPGLGRDE